MIILGKYKVVNMKRFKTFLFMLVFFISLTLFILLSTITAYSKEEIMYDYVYIKAGDTLWEIADKYNNNINIKKFINIIMKENSLSNTVIYPGDIIKIPLIY